MKLYDVIQKEYPKQGEHHDDTSVPLQEHHSIHPKKRSRKKRIIFFGTIALVIGLLYSLGITFVRARVVVNERTIPAAFSDTIIEIPHETNTDSERLSFQTMKVTTQITREIFGSEFKEVTGKAKGAVVFINEFSTTTQTIRTGTRLIADNGKAYLTQATVTVPGYKIDSKTKKKTAGTSTSVPVIAVDVGASYNSQGTSLAVSSFSGTKRKQLYARSAGAFTGGEAGVMHTVSEAEKEAVIETLKTQLVERLRRETRAQIPENFITYPELQFISIDIDSLKLTGEGIKFPATIAGSMTTYLIPQDRFEQTLANEALQGTTYADVVIPELQSFTVTPTSAVPTNSDTPPESISVSVSGEGVIIAQVAPEKIKGLLVGARKNTFASLIATIPEIQSAESSLYPFWAPYFPKKTDLIYVNIK
jgi:hypothetical protein